jgi:hypothetical protein
MRILEYNKCVLLLTTFLENVNRPLQMENANGRNNSSLWIDRAHYIRAILLFYRLATQEEVEKAKASPSFEREYNLKSLGLLETYSSSIIL